MPVVKRLLAFALSCFLTACGGEDPIQPQPPAYSLLVVGRVERGLVVRIAAQRSGDTTTVPITGLALSPADAGTLQGSGEILLTKAGPATVSGVGPGGTALTLAITVATPPAIVFDGRTAGNKDLYRVVLDGASLTRLTSVVAEDVKPTVAGDFVLYTSYRDGNAELYALSLLTGNERRLTNSATNEAQPSVATNGRIISYTSNVGGTSKVWIANLDLTSTTSPLTGAARLAPATFGAATLPESTPTWSANSDKVFFVATATPTGSAGIFSAVATAGAQPALVGGSGANIEVEPTASPDGLRVAYASPVAGVTEIFVRDLQTSVATQVTRNAGSHGQPSWMPDGRILFTTFSGATSTLQWVDPAIPFVLHEIPTPGLVAEHAAAVRP